MEFDIHLMGNLMPCVEASDVIFAASGSEELLVGKEDLVGLSVASAAVGGVRRFIDISVPRNIAPGINELDSAIVYNVDDLKEVGAGVGGGAGPWLGLDREGRRGGGRRAGSASGTRGWQWQGVQL